MSVSRNEPKNYKLGFEGLVTPYKRDKFPSDYKYNLHTLCHHRNYLMEGIDKILDQNKSSKQTLFLLEKASRIIEKSKNQDADAMERFEKAQKNIQIKTENSNKFIKQIFNHIDAHFDDLTKIRKKYDGLNKTPLKSETIFDNNAMESNALEPVESAMTIDKTNVDELVVKLDELQASLDAERQQKRKIQAELRKTLSEKTQLEVSIRVLTYERDTARLDNRCLRRLQ